MLNKLVTGSSIDRDDQYVLIALINSVRFWISTHKYWPKSSYKCNIIVFSFLVNLPCDMTPQLQLQTAEDIFEHLGY